MASFQPRKTDGAQPGLEVPDDMVLKVGAAVGKLALIQQNYQTQVEAETAAPARQELADQAQRAAIEAIDAEGISVEEYNEVLSAAENDPALEARLIDAAREAM
jgi:hypothetical protein